MEKYGTIPKRFTKAWWEYFWTYYKLHTISLAIGLAIIISLLYQCANIKKYDFKLTVAGSTTFTEIQNAKIEEKLAPAAFDCDGNGEVNLLIQNLLLDSKKNNTEYQVVMSQKLMVEFNVSDGLLFIFDEDVANIYLEDPACKDAFVPVAEWATEPYDDEKLAFSEGSAYGVNLSESKILSEIEFDSENCYLMLRKMRADEKDDPTGEIKRDNAYRAANMLIRK